VVGRCGVVECRLSAQVASAGHMTYSVAPLVCGSACGCVVEPENTQPVLEPGYSTTVTHRKYEKFERFDSLIVYSLPPRCL
jgi:hypothetical protein